MPKKRKTIPDTTQTDIPVAPPSSKRPQSSTSRIPQPTDEFQQVTRSPFVNTYRINLGPGAEVFYQPDMISAQEAEGWYAQLMGLDTYQPMLKLYGRTFPQSRHIAAYSTTPLTLKYSGTDVIMHHPFPPILQTMQTRLEAALGVQFNHVMLNRYDDGSVYIGRHSDNLNNLVIASLSLGAARTFVLSPRVPARSKRKKDQVEGALEDLEDLEGLGERKSRKWMLENGSLVVMQGRTQEYWKHEIPKESHVKTGRISLTFRQLV